MLIEATGLSRSRLDQRFQDKHGLFQKAVELYTERVLHRMRAAPGRAARERLESILRGLVPGAARRPPGCLLARSCAELADLPDSGQRVALAGVRLQREWISGLLRAGIEEAALPSDADVEALSWHFLGVLQSVLNLPQAGASALALERMISLAMTAWPEAEMQEIADQRQDAE